jgi:hypothetical protein
LATETSSDNLYSTSFARVPRQKALAFWSTHQVAVAFALIALFSLNLLAGRSPFSPFTLALCLVMAADLLVIRGLSIWQIIGTRLGFALLSATGRARSTVSPLTVGATVGLLDIPGNDGSVDLYRIVNTAYEGACYVWDAAKGEATACIRVRGLDAQLASFSRLSSLSAQFSAAVATLRDKGDVTRVVIQSRALHAPVRPSGDGPADSGSLADRDIRYVEESVLSMPFEHDHVVTITVDPSKAQGESAARSTPADVSRLLSARVEELMGSLSGTGVDEAAAWKWLNMQQLRGLMKTLIDPTATALLDAKGRLPDDIPLALSWHAHATWMEVGPLFARTRWIDRWPDGKNPVFPSWLSNVTSATMTPMVLTQVFRARDEHTAKKQVTGQLHETETMSGINRRLGRSDDKRTVAEAARLDEHLADIANDGGDIEFQGFVTIFADSRDRLDAACSRFDGRTSKWIHMDAMRDQQLARFNGVWPLGLEGRES